MKIAIVGSAPSSAALAPYDDPEWTIWACSVGSVQYTKRVDARFEIHRWADDQPWITPEYKDHLRSVNGPVYMIQKEPDIPNSEAYPKDEMIKRFGYYFFTSTPAWMLALAITEDPEEIAIYGIDMATDDEYALQKQGCLHFIEKAKDAGIKVTVPPQSDLLQPPPLYGFCEVDPRFVKMNTRMEELQARIASANANIDNSTREKLYLSGAEDNMRYVMNTWVN